MRIMKINKIIKICLIVVFMINCFLTVPSVSMTTNIENTSNMNHIPILFVHGGDYSGSDWNIMKNRFITDGWNESILYNPTTRDFSYCGSIINKANIVKLWVDQLLSATQSKKVDIITHGSSGLIVRYYLKFMDGVNKTDTLITLAAPNHGRNVCYTPWDSTIVKLDNGDETPYGNLPDTIGNRTGPFGFEHYNSTHIPGSVKYVSIYNDQDNHFPYISSPLDGALNIELNQTNLSHTTFYTNQIVYNLTKTALTNYDSLLPSSLVPVTTTSSQSNTAEGYTMFLFVLPMVMIVIFRKRK